MKYFLVTLSIIGLLLTVVPAFLVYGGVLSFATHKTVATVGSVLWLVTAPFWMNQRTTNA